MPAPRARTPLPSGTFPSVFSKQKDIIYSDHSSSSSRSLSSSRTLSHTLSWSPLGNLIATASERTIRVWNPERNASKNSTELRGHGGYVDCVAFNPRKEAELASCGGDGVVRLWDVRAKKATGEVRVGGAGQGAYRIAWRPDGGEMVVGRTERKKGSREREDTLISVSLSTLSQLEQFPQSLEAPSFTFSNSGLELFIATNAGTVDIVDYPSFSHLYTLRGHTAACYCVAMSPTGAYVATGASDSLAMIWDTKDWIPKYPMTALAGTVRSLSFTFDGSYVVGGSDEGNGLHIKHVESGDDVCTIPLSTPTPCVAWHPNRYALAYTGDPSGLKIIGGMTRS
ncbi:MAG: hypothetical protein Q9157_000139 [Trypethelium eluteriae]